MHPQQPCPFRKAALGGEGMKLLLIEDESRMADALSGILKLENYEVEIAKDGEAGLSAVLTGNYDIIISDVMLPGTDGFEIVSQARRAGIRTPILMLTAKGELEDKVAGLDSGADDYLTKPFMMKELLARLRALTRRSVKQPDGMLSFGDLELRIPNLMLTCITTKESVRLSDKEYRLLRCFMESRGRILTRETLAVRIWGYENEAEYNNVEVYLSFTRKKLSFIGSRTQIKAVRGVGYELKDEKCIES